MATASRAGASAGACSTASSLARRCRSISTSTPGGSEATGWSGSVAGLRRRGASSRCVRITRWTGLHPRRNRPARPVRRWTRGLASRAPTPPARTSARFRHFAPDAPLRRPSRHPGQGRGQSTRGTGLFLRAIRAPMMKRVPGAVASGVGRRKGRRWAWPQHTPGWRSLSPRRAASAARATLPERAAPPVRRRPCPRPAPSRP